MQAANAPGTRWPFGFAPNWLRHVVLLFITFLTCTAFGSAVVNSFARNRPLTADAIVEGYGRLLGLQREVWTGLWFSLPLLAILLAHELGHYLECRRRQIDASLPYFLPSPLMFGTFGAFIRIRTPIYTREGLYDVGIGGPLAGFCVLLPILLAGVAASKVGPLLSSPDAIVFGTPPILHLLESVRFPGVPPERIVLHPVALAAWAGLFATALNLLPIGQLDGGHIVYALGGERWHRRVSLALFGALVVAGRWYWPWWIWACALFVFGRRHPLIYDAARLSPSRVVLACVALLIFVLSATVVPFRAF